MKKFVFVLMALVSVTALGDVAQTPESVVQLNVAFAGPDLNALTQQTVALLKACDRAVTNIQITSTFGTGRPAGVAIHHVLANPVTGSCTPATQMVAVNFFGDFFSRANEILGFLHMANKQVYNFAFTSFFGTGKPAAGVFYYCN